MNPSVFGTRGISGLGTADSVTLPGTTPPAAVTAAAAASAMPLQPSEAQVVGGRTAAQNMAIVFGIVGGLAVGLYLMHKPRRSRR